MPKLIEKLHYLTQDLKSSSHVEQAAVALSAGIKWVQFRTKLLVGQDIYNEAMLIKKLCKKHAATFLINDHPELALHVAADGVHLGKQDMPVSEARELLGSDFIIGRTINSKSDLTGFDFEQVNYLGVGPYRFTKTKEKLSPVLTNSDLKELIETIKQVTPRMPVIIIGGILASDITQILDLGADGLAVASGINQAEDPTSAVRKYVIPFNVS